MNEFEPLPVEPIRYSLILTGLVLRTRSLTDALCAPQVAVAVMSPLNDVMPEVTLSVRLTVAPGATGSAIVTGASALQPLGTVMPSLTPDTAAPVVFLKVTIVSWLEPGENVCSPDGPAGVLVATNTLPFFPLPEESVTVSPLASSNL